MNVRSPSGGRVKNSSTVSYFILEENWNKNKQKKTVLLMRRRERVSGFLIGAGWSAMSETLNTHLNHGFESWKHKTFGAGETGSAELSVTTTCGMNEGWLNVLR